MNRFSTAYSPQQKVRKHAAQVPGYGQNDRQGSSSLRRRRPHPHGVPLAFGVSWNITVIVMVSLGMVASAYIAETLRAGLQAVPKGQLEAARSLGMPQWRAMITIVIPQAFKIVLPPLTNEVILLTKDSSLIYVLGLTASQYELTKFGRDGISSLGAGLTPLLVAGAFYLVITIPLSLLARKFETRSARTKR